MTSSSSLKHDLQLPGDSADITPEIRRLVNKGKKYYDKGEKQKAAQCFVAAWNQAPKNSGLLILVSHILGVLGVRHKALEVLEQALAINGPKPDILAVLGDMALEMHMYDVAEKLFRIYISQMPNEAIGYNNLASAIGNQGRLDEAIAMLRDTIPIFPESPLLWNALGTFVASRDGYETAKPFYEESYRLNPNYYQLLNNLALAYANTGEYERAVEMDEQAILVNPEGYYAHMGLGTSLLALGQLERGWQEYEWRQHPRRHGAVLYTHGLPRWKGESLAGKRLLIGPEQGLGDEILFSLAFPEIARQADELYIGCDRRLVPLLQRSFPKARFSHYIDSFNDAYRYRTLPLIQGEARDGFEPADVFIEAGSLPNHLWKSLDRIPQFPEGHLVPDAKRVAFWKKRLKKLGPNLKVGMSWRSGVQNADRNKLYTTIEQWAPLFAVEGVDFINLQYDECSAELALAKEKFGVTIHDWDDLDLRNDIDDTAALVKALDLVIGPTSTPGTIAMAMGVEIWWLIRYKPWWCFGTEGAPFHPKASFMSVPLSGRWETLMPDVAERLRARAQEKAR